MMMGSVAAAMMWLTLGCWWIRMSVRVKVSLAKWNRLNVRKSVSSDTLSGIVVGVCTSPKRMSE